MSYKAHMKGYRSGVLNTGSKRGRQFLVYGRALPTASEASPAVIVVRVTAPNAAVARSRFWKLNMLDHKLKRSRGEVLQVQEVHDRTSHVAKNFGVFLKYRSHTGVHNMFKEFRDVKLAGAVDQMYNELGGNYKASAERIEIVKTTELQKDDLKVRNPRCLQWVDTESITYPLWKRTARPTHAKFANTFSRKRPVVFKTGVSVDK